MLRLLLLCLSLFMPLLTLGAPNQTTQEPSPDIAGTPPFNPACLALLNPDIKSGVPVTTRLNLNDCDLPTGPIEHSAAGYYFHRPSGKGFFGARYIGSTPKKVSVYYIYNNMGGSGTFSSIALLKPASTSYLVYNDQGKWMRRRTGSKMDKVIGYIQGGDRCMGGFASVDLKGNTLSIEKYVDAKSPSDCSKTKKLSLNLSRF
ncbi:MAG: hypothetical protein CMF50_09160 [Legionellales bacterium]|nr:hypothetical protein [Legionellales bacterium]